MGEVRTRGQDTWLVLGFAGFVAFGAAGLFDEGGEIVWWLLAFGCLLGLLGNLIHQSG